MLLNMRMMLTTEIYDYSNGTKWRPRHGRMAQNVQPWMCECCALIASVVSLSLTLNSGSKLFGFGPFLW